MRNFGELPSGHIDLSRPKSNPRFVLGVNRSGLFFGVTEGPVFGRGSELKNRDPGLSLQRRAASSRD